jgi:hypothetical protein
MLYTFDIVMHWINWLLRQAKVDEQVSWWSGGQTCYQVPLSTVVKLVVRFLAANTAASFFWWLMYSLAECVE